MEVLAGVVGKEVVKTAVKTSLDSVVKLIKYEWGLEDAVKDGLKSLKAELEMMQACIANISSGPQDQINSVDKLWLNEVNELSYTIKTGLQSFTSSIESAKGTLLSAASKLAINHQIASFIKDIMIKAKEVSERRRRYDYSSSKTTSAQKVDPRIFALYEKKSDLVGLAGATDELTKMLSTCDHVSIVGMGGMGKTTLAQAVYGKLQMKGEFSCCAFVTVGQNASGKKVLKDILYELEIEINGGDLNEMQLINKLQKSLVGKRCLFFIDDIWDNEAVKLIKCALVDNPESRIITTTRKLEVAKQFGGVYMMKLLSDTNSKELLQTRLFGAEAKSHDTEFARLSERILSKCGGVPLAIVAIARLLAKKPREEWSKVYDYIGFSEHEGDVEKDILRILSFSYSDLPYHLQKCFLYLSLFPEGHWIEKNMLIWRWVAEGLVSTVSNEEKLGLFELGEIYFNELIDRSMIQRAVSPRDIGQGGCRVHKMMFDLIRRLSSSENENFSTVIGTKRESTSQTSTIHRLAIHRTRVDESENTSTLPKKGPNNSLEVGEVLSFYASTCSGSSLPPISKFRGLRVIDLEGCDLSDGDRKLEHLAKLRELAYLGLLGTPVAELPKEIGLLKFLQTLDVTGTSIKELPPFVEELKKLRCLRAGKGTAMKGRVGELTSLEELWLHSADKSPDFAAELRKLTQLRVLVVHLDKMDQATGNVLVESLSDLTKLQVLQIWSDDAEEKVYFSSWGDSMPSKELRQLLLFGVILPKSRPWIHSCVQKLSKLLLQVETLEAVHLEIMGQMPSLLSLYLHSEDDNRLSYTASKDEFKVLEFLYTNIELICGDGALPMIRELEVGGIRAGMDVGLRGNMPLLQKATYHLDCSGRLPLRVQKAEEELRQAGKAHPNGPEVSIRRWNNIVTEMWHVMELIEGTPVRLVRPPPSQENIFDDPEFVKKMSEDFARAICMLKLPVGEPPVLRVDDATDATGSPSQGPAALFMNLFNQLQHMSGPRSATSSADADANLDEDADLDEDANLAESSCTGASRHEPPPEPATTRTLLSSVLSWLNSPDGAAKISKEAHNHGINPVSYKRIWKKCVLNPELVAIIDSLVHKNDISKYKRLHGQLMDQEILDYFTGHDIDEPSSPPGYAGVTREPPPPKVDNMLSWLISLYGAAHVSTLMSKGAAEFGMDPAAFERMWKKYVLNPELVAAMNSAVQNNDGSEFKRLLAQVMEQENMNYFAEQPKLDTASKLLSWLNTPEGAAFMSEGAAIMGMDPFDFERIYKKCVLKPESIAAWESAVQNHDCSEINQLVIQLMLPEILNHFAVDDINEPSSPPRYASVGRVDADSTRAALPESSGQDGENFSRILTQVLPAVEQALAAGPSSGQPIAAQVDAHSELPADASGKLSGLSSDPALAAQSDMIDALASSTASEAQSRQDGEDSSTIFNLNERLAIMEKALAADESSGKRSSAQVDADSVLSRGGPADASDTLSGLSSDPALAAQSDMIDAVAASTPSVAQSGQGGEISTTFNLNELLAALEKAAAAGESSGQPSSAQPDNVGHEEGGGA